MKDFATESINGYENLRHYIKHAYYAGERLRSLYCNAGLGHWFYCHIDWTGYCGLIKNSGLGLPEIEVGVMDLPRLDLKPSDRLADLLPSLREDRKAIDIVINRIEEGLKDFDGYLKGIAITISINGNFDDTTHNEGKAVISWFEGLCKVIDKCLDNYGGTHCGLCGGENE